MGIRMGLETGIALHLKPVQPVRTPGVVKPVAIMVAAGVGEAFSVGSADPAGVIVASMVVVEETDGEGEAASSPVL